MVREKVDVIVGGGTISVLAATQVIPIVLAGTLWAQGNSVYELPDGDILAPDSPQRAEEIVRTHQVRLTRQFGVSPQRVFDAWTDSKTAGSWLFAAGQSLCVEIDARARGWFYVAGRRNGEKVEYVGEYLDVVRPHRLVFALLAEKYSLNFERVTVLLNPRGMGCELGLTHETRVEFAQRSRRDWVGVLERLGAMLSKAGRTAA